MVSFGLICEGVTDQAVISNILDGFFGVEVDVRYILPSRDETNRSGFSNWQILLENCKEQTIAEALQFNQFIIIQIDTDVSEEKGFDVPKYENGEELAVADLYQKVKKRMIAEMGQACYEKYKQQILFAICIHSLECWILPLHAESNKHKQTKNCLSHLNQAHAKKKKNQAFNKRFHAYRELTNAYRKPKGLKQGRTNPSLCIFLDELEKMKIVLPSE